MLGETKEPQRIGTWQYTTDQINVYDHLPRDNYTVIDVVGGLLSCTAVIKVKLIRM